MKKMMILAAVAAFAVGCGGDDDNATVNEGALGTWKLTSLTASQAVDANNDGNATTNLIAEAGCFDQSTLVFGTDGNAVNTIVVPGEDDCFPFSSNATYVDNGNVLTLTTNFDGETDVTNFTKSGNTMTATVVDFYEIEVTVNGETTYESIDAVLVYTKQ